MTTAPPTLPQNADRDRRMARLLMLARRHQRFANDQSNVRSADMRLLWLLNDSRPRTLREISDALGLEQSTVNRQVAAAQSHGLVKRIRDTGAPAQVIEATHHGLTAFESALAVQLRNLEAGLRALGDVDAEKLLTLLDRFVTAYGEAAHDGKDQDDQPSTSLH